MAWPRRWPQLSQKLRSKNSGATPPAQSAALRNPRSALQPKNPCWRERCGWRSGSHVLLAPFSLVPGLGVSGAHFVAWRQVVPALATGEGVSALWDARAPPGRPSTADAAANLRRQGARPAHRSYVSRKPKASSCRCSIFSPSRLRVLPASSIPERRLCSRHLCPSQVLLVHHPPRK